MCPSKTAPRQPNTSAERCSVGGVRVRTRRTSARSLHPRPNNVHQVSLGSPRRVGLFTDYHDSDACGRHMDPSSQLELGVIVAR